MRCGPSKELQLSSDPAIPRASWPFRHLGGCWLVCGCCSCFRGSCVSPSGSGVPPRGESGSHLSAAQGSSHPSPSLPCGQETNLNRTPQHMGAHPSPSSPSERRGWTEQGWPQTVSFLIQVTGRADVAKTGPPETSRLPSLPFQGWSQPRGRRETLLPWPLMFPISRKAGA